MLTVNQQKLKQAITDYLDSDGEKDPGLVSMSKSLLETIGEKETYGLIRNATLKRRNVTPYELEFRLPEYLNYNGVQVERAEFIKDFRKAMEE